MQSQLIEHIFEHSQQLILTLDEQGCICSINPFTCKLLGQSPEQLLGQNWIERYVPVEEQTQLLRHLNEVRTYQLPHATFSHHVIDMFGERHAFEWHHGFVQSEDRKPHVACLGQDMTELETTQQHLRFLKDYDKLTQLPKMDMFKQLFEHALNMAKRHQQKVALFFIDIDNLKIINDRYGHQVGDELIQQVAKRLGTATAENHTLASFGGDEFVLLIENADTQQLFEHCELISDLFSQPFQTQLGEIMVSCSMGVSLFPDDGDDSQTLLKHADIAKNRAKSDGKNQFHFYQSGMDTEINQMHVLEVEMKKALLNREFTLYYQPQIDSQHHCLLACEALIRWKNPLLGWVSPAEFIPFAEKTNLIVPIGDWVLTEAINQHLLWQSQGFPIPISINVSPKQLLNPQFVERLLNIQTQYPTLNLEMLELEITETTMIEHPDQTYSLLEKLEKLGIRVAIDDFGTGYSSFAALKRGAFHKVKLDRSFVSQLDTNPEDAVIVTAMVRMAETLGLKMIAEGVENREQLAMLQSIGCHHIQGFYFGRPMLPEHCTEHLRQQHIRLLCD